MGSKPSSAFLAYRAILAVALMIGFYLLAICIAGVLAYLPIAEVIYAQRIHFQLALICFVSAGVILWSILPRIDRFPPPGPRLEPADHPRLFELLRRVSELTKQQMPSEVYLCPDVNAWVAQRGGLMGFGSRRVMGIGLPLLQVFTVSEFSAVLAHEFGHYHGGDTKLGPWVYKTRSMIGRTLAGLGNSVIQKPFLWYGNLYLRITHSISRRQEYLADEIAAQAVSPGALVSGLKKVHAAAMGFNAYLHNELAPVLSLGMRSPFLEGFNQYRATKRITDFVASDLEKELKEGKANPYDTHPALKDRIAALELIKCSPSKKEDASPAIELLSDYGRYDSELVAALTGRKFDTLQLVAWEEVGHKVYVPLWKKSIQEHSYTLKGKTVGDLYNFAKAPEEFIAQVEPNAVGTLQQKCIATTNILGAALSVTLASQGWIVKSELGESIRLNKEGQSLEPFELVSRVTKGTLEKSEWDQYFASCESLVIDL